jgi:esterase
MKLYHRKLGKGSPLIILHGLYGSSDNWLSIGRKLSEHFEVWMVDLRNHGRSPHSADHNYNVMAADLLELMYDNHLTKAIIMGHSMGGKVAMNFALKNAKMISHLIILDIAPKSYSSYINIDFESLNHKKIIEELLKFDFRGLETREQLDLAFSESIKDAPLRQFLLKNITRGYDDDFTWKINLMALYSNINEIIDGVNLKPENLEDDVADFPVLFVKGANSEYITLDDEEIIKLIFPYSEFVSISSAGHLLHIEQPEQLIKAIYNFLKV